MKKQRFEKLLGNSEQDRLLETIKHTMTMQSIEENTVKNDQTCILQEILLPMTTFHSDAALQSAFADDEGVKRGNEG